MDVVERLERLVDTHDMSPQRSRRFDKFVKLAMSGVQDDSEIQRVWLEQVIALKGIGYGLNICCGDFPIANTEGVDVDSTVLGLDWNTSGDDLYFREMGSVDYVITNYLEALPDPIKLFKEWHRVLKPAGFIAIVCVNAEEYDPLNNSRKVMSYTSNSLRDYLNLAGFDLEQMDARGHHLYVVACKGEIP